MSEGFAIREVLRLPVLRGGQLLAGCDGADRSVRSVNVMEVPDILDWVRPGELLLTTAYPFREEPEALSTLVSELAERELAGLAIKSARYIDEIPRSMLRDADRLAFPLINLPPEASFNDIIHEVLTILLNRQAVKLQRAAAIHDRFNEIVLTGGGFSRIAQALSESIDRPVAIVDADGSLRAATAGLIHSQLDFVARMVVQDGECSLQRSTRRIDVGGGVFIAQPILSGDSRHGAILALGESDDLSEDALEALQYAATVTALRQVQARALAEEDRRFKTLCLEDLVSEHPVDREALLERASAFGWDLHLPRTVLIAQIEPMPNARVHDAGRATGISELAAAARASLPTRTVVWERSSEIAALVAVGGSNPESTRSLGEAFRSEAEQRVRGARAIVGIGRICHTPEELPRVFGQARQALTVGRSNHGPGVHLFEDLGVERLLANTADEELMSYWRALIGPLVDHDATHGSELLPSLARFLAVRNVAEAARQLYVHQNTLHKRLDRIESIIGAFQGHPDRCLELGLAIRIHRLGRAGSS